jgi:serine/threonine protein kinase
VGLIRSQTDANLVAYHTLVENGILHRDISENNVLVNIIGDSGLFIDLDMAKDLWEEEDASKISSSIFRIFRIREPANRSAHYHQNATQAVHVASTHPAIHTAPTQGASLVKDPSDKPNPKADVRGPITVCS